MKTALFPDPPLAHHGQLLLGPTPDGTEYASYNLFDTSRAHHGLLLCDEFDGISNLATGITASARANYPVNTLYLSNNHYATNPALPHSTTVTASNPAEHADLLTKLESIASYRDSVAVKNKLCSLIGQMPLLHVIVDGADQIIHRDAVTRWFTLAQRGGKLGIAILAVVYTSAARYFAQHTALCASLAQNTIAVGAHVRGSYTTAKDFGLGDISHLGDSAGRIHQPGLAAPMTFQPFHVRDQAHLLARYPDAAVDERDRRILHNQP